VAKTYFEVVKRNGSVIKEEISGNLRDRSDYGVALGISEVQRGSTRDNSKMILITQSEVSLTRELSGLAGTISSLTIRCPLDEMSGWLIEDVYERAFKAPARRHQILLNYQGR